MNTDDEMDGLLREAGARWRSANLGSARTVDFQTAPTAAPARRSRWLVMASAAVVVAAVAVGATWLGAHRDHVNTQAVGPVSTPPSQASQWHGLTATNWTIFEVTLDHPNSHTGLDATGSSASLRISDDGTFLASDGINSVSGSVTIDATTLHFSNVATSAIGSRDPKVGAIAGAIDSILQGDVTWSVNPAGDSSDLYIEHPGVGSLIYFGQPPAAVVTDPAKLQGRWNLVSYQQTNKDGSAEGGSVGSASAGGSASLTGIGDYLTVSANGTFTVEHRCYTNTGRVVTGSGTATWSDVHLERALPCPAAPDQADEQALTPLVDSVLSGATTWKIDNFGQLIVSKGGDALTFAPA